MKQLAAIVLMMVFSLVVLAQQESTLKERRVPLSEAAIALDTAGNSTLEATLLSSELQGRPDSPITNIRMVVKNSSQTSVTFVSGVVTFYDNGGTRCGEGVFKADMLAAGESFETDSPGIRIRCTVTTWRIVASNLVPRIPEI